LLTFERFLEGMKKPFKALFLPESKVTYVYYIDKGGRKVKLGFDGLGTTNLGDRKLFKAVVTDKHYKNTNMGKFYETNKKQELVVTHFARTGKSPSGVEMKETVINHSDGMDKKPVKIARNGVTVFNKGNMSV